ncbi:imidazoleglycerol-phosphate dehydratase HisB [Oscillospiraceae bacterium OttesenSCG-928-G22]|nr:imidazoleglycerol-phosphate dehydratase HisB [Oscillospiraceae bacterium OttesenSCG-928-G22]
MREGRVSRKTKETDLAVLFRPDGGDISIDTGIGFFDHLLTSFAFHGGFGLSLTARGDLHVDGHHTAEDAGLALGEAFRLALGDRAGIARFGERRIPMDEALACCAVDVSGRPYLVYRAAFIEERVGTFDVCLAEEFFRAFSQEARVTLHLEVPYGKNAHHMLEGLFKACGMALSDAVRVTGTAIPSTKGVL